MAGQQNPKRQPKPKPKKLNLSSKAAWRSILKDVEKKEVPIHVLDKLVVYLKDGSQAIIDIKSLLALGADPEEVELQINQKLQDLDMYIDNVDFFVDIESVERTVQPETDRLLSKL
jgi:uncharacterized protein YneR